VAHLRERDNASHLSRALESCLKGTVIPAQASPMIVRSVCSPQIVRNCPPTLRPSPGGSEGIGALLTAAGMSGGAGGLAAALAMHQPSPVPEKTRKSEPAAENAANAQAAKKSKSEDKTPEAKTQSERGVTDRPNTPERKEVQLSTATTPHVDKSPNKLHILKQLTSVARGLWHRVAKVIKQLCRALQVSESSLNRALKVANRILCSIKARELLYDRHLHQVLMCVVFAACRVEDPDKVLFRKIINHHHALYAHLQLNEQIYWMLEIGPAANQTGLPQCLSVQRVHACIMRCLCSHVCVGMCVSAACAVRRTAGACSAPSDADNGVRRQLDRVLQQEVHSPLQGVCARRRVSAFPSPKSPTLERYRSGYVCAKLRLASPTKVVPHEELELAFVAYLSLRASAGGEDGGSIVTSACGGSVCWGVGCS
jgi:hypothetical protein